jgi:hypothetical protein
MVLARFQFKPDHADQFCWRAGQTVTEMTFDSVIELIEFCQEVEDALEDCTVFTGSDIITLKSFVH